MDFYTQFILIEADKVNCVKMKTLTLAVSDYKKIKTSFEKDIEISRENNKKLMDSFGLKL